MLDIHQINRSFGARQVLTDVNFTVKPGRMTGFVGSNGAGKTTTMRIILGVLAADSGTVTLNGTALGPDDRRIFGYMPEERGLYPKMHVAEQLIYLARLHGLSADAAKHNSEQLLERLGLTERAGTNLESLSLGNQQRVQIAAALVHDPEILILDEPFSGLDPVAVETVVGVLKDRANAGVPVLFSSHQLELVERLCDDLIVIADGSIRAAGSREDLRRQHTLPRYEIVIDGYAGWIKELEGIDVVDLDSTAGNGHAVFDAQTSALSQQVLQQALQRGAVLSFTQQQPSLTQIFREVIQ